MNTEYSSQQRGEEGDASTSVQPATSVPFPDSSIWQRNFYCRGTIWTWAEHHSDAANKNLAWNTTCSQGTFPGLRTALCAGVDEFSLQTSALLRNSMSRNWRKSEVAYRKVYLDYTPGKAASVYYLS